MPAKTGVGGVSWLIKSCFDNFQRNNERIKVKKLLMAKCDS